VPATPVTRRGDLWILGDYRLLCGDSTDGADVTRLMNGERAALFASDPPCLVDYDGTNHPTKKAASARAKKIANRDWGEDYIEQPHWDDSSQGPQFYKAFCKVAIDHANDENVAWYCWHASRRQRMVETVWDMFDVLHHQQIIWAKSRPVLTRSVMLWAHEPCMFGWVRGKKPRINREGFESWPTTVWNIPSSEIETRDHPTSKPVRVFTLPMQLHTRPGDICYEPFSGSGSQLIAGEKTGRKVYGLELSEAFCDVVIRRWQEFTGKTATLDGDGRSFDDIAAERVPDPGMEPRMQQRHETVAHHVAGGSLRQCCRWLRRRRGCADPSVPAVRLVDHAGAEHGHGRAIFAVVSIARSYCLRRTFEALRMSRSP
jgi:DNA modification methylase